MYDCSAMNISTIMTYNSTATIEEHWKTSLGSSETSPNPTLMTTSEQNLLYGAKCINHEDCSLSRNLFCEYEYDLNEKHCLCEATFFWNKNIQQCGKVFFLYMTSSSL